MLIINDNTKWVYKMADLYSGILLFYLFFVDYLVRGGKYTTFWQNFTVVDKKYIRECSLHVFV